MSRILLQQALDALDMACAKYGDVGNIYTDWGKWDAAGTALRDELAKPEQEAYGYAKRLAEFIWEKHYKKESPDWTPLPDVLGVLTQIDNMTCGLELAKPEMPTKIFGPNLEQILNAAGFYRREWVGLTDEERNEMRSIVQGHTKIDAPTYGLTLQYATEEVLKEKNGG